jgi:hypothetical protein
VNNLNVFADYAFWLAAVILASVAASEFISRSRVPGAPVRKGVLYALALISVLVVGLVVIPAATARSGVLVNSGSSFSFDPLNSFIRVPFEASHNGTLNGAFESSAPVDVYVMNSSQFISFDMNGDYCPLKLVKALSVNAIAGSVGTNIGSGSYSLVFCAIPHDRNIQVTITSPVKLSA